MALLRFITLMLYSVGVIYSASDGSESLIVKLLTWKYTAVNPNCSDGSGRNPCQDIRVCDFARASLKMGGQPAICDWVSEDVPKVCCGLPLVLGERLMRTVQSERATTRECGTTVYSKATSPTQDRFFEILKSLPPIDISDPNKFDPPLDLTVEPMVSPVGGSPTIEGKYPWMVAIFKRRAFWCGGSLIDRKHILSAAHCFVNTQEELNPARYTVRLGSIYLDKAVPFKVSKITVHENYDGRTHYDDIAILTLEEEILLPHVAHVCLPDAHLAARDLTELNTTLLGWGDLAFGGVNTPVLHEVKDIPVVSNYECNKVYQPITRNSLPRGLTQDFICAGLDEGGKDACQRDSGGPLLYKNNVDDLPPYNPDIPWVLVGIVSFGAQCGDPGYPGVYTRVSNYMEWIIKNSAES